MNNLIFKLDTNNQNIFEKNLPYKLDVDELTIYDDKCEYTINTKEEIFIKKDEEHVINIDLKNKIVNITLLENKLSFDMNLLKSKFENVNNIINIEYTLDDGENTYNCIFIKFN